MFAHGGLEALPAAWSSRTPRPDKQQLVGTYLSDEVLEKVAQQSK